MLFKQLDKTTKKRFFINMSLLLAGTVLLMLFLFFMQSQSARIKQKNDSLSVLNEIDAALLQNESQIESLKTQYHEVNLSKLKSVRRMFGYGIYREILQRPVKDQNSLLLGAKNAMGAELLFLIDEKGNIKIKPEEYKEFFPEEGVEWNLVSMGLLSEEQLKDVLDVNNQDAPLMVSYDDKDYYYYCLPINVRDDESVDRLFLLARESADILELELSSVSDVGKILGDVTIGTTGFAFASDSESGKFIYFNDGMIDLSGRDYHDFGLTDDAMADGYCGTQKINDEKYYCVSRKSSASFIGSNTVITAVEKESEIMDERIKVIAFAIIAFLAVSIFIIIYSIILLSDAAIRGKSLKLQKIFSFKGHEYCINKRLLKALLPATLVGILLFFGVSMYSQTLLSLSRAINQSERSHEEIEQKLITNNAIRDVMTEYYENQYLSKALMTECLLEETPGLAFSPDPNDMDSHPLTSSVNGARVEAKDDYGNVVYSCANSKRLNEICEDNNFTSIYIFDDRGRVRATSGSDWYFTVSENEEDQSYAFWDVIDGKKAYLIQKVMTSDAGESMQFIGCGFEYYTCLGNDGTTQYVPEYMYSSQEKGEYDGPTIKCHRGMVQIGISAETIEHILEVTSFDYVLSQMYVMDNGYIIAFDNDENHTILFSPNKYTLNKPAKEMDFVASDFDDSYNGFKTLGGQKFFVIVREAAGRFIATAIPTESLYRVRNNIALASLFVGLLVIIGILAMTVIMREDEWEAYKKIMEDMTSNVYITKAEGQSSDAFIRHKTPEQKLARLVKVYVYLLVIGVWAYFLIFGSSGRSTLMNYILRFSWNRVPGIISFTACGIILFSVIAGLDLVGNIVVNLSKSLGVRAATISHLFMACVKFVAICVAIFVCLYLIGFDARSLLTGAGPMSVVVGFGAQHLIADILSGIFIVLEGSFRVGDYVTIGDFRGEVLEIGLRTTKIESDDFNVKIFNNSAISEIINMTKENSFASIVVEIPYDSDVALVEKIVRESFETLRKKYDKIVADPIYRGITNFGASGIEVNIWVPCFEKDRPQMERDIRKEIIQLFNEHNINVPFSHVVIAPYEKSDIKD